jgi:poly-gamma-glutamate system protein
MKQRQGKIPILILIIVTLITILLMYLELRSKHRVRTAFYNEKIAAAELTQNGFDKIKQAIDSLYIPIDRINDPNETGLIGIQYSPITTERGDLNIKLTTTNPNFAALAVKLIKKASIRKGDTVAVALTGSYPALNIALLSALEILGAEPVIITSAGSSMWGANNPQFTYLDMEMLLYQNELINKHTIAASFGGEDDMGRGLSPEGREYLEASIRKNEIILLENSNLEEAIENRIDIYSRYKNIKLFINAGEHTTSWIGLDPGYGFIPGGRIKQGKGIIAYFSKKGIPVVNFENITQLAVDNGLEQAPIPLPDIGEGSLYHTYKYSVTQAIISLIILAVMMIIVFKFDIEHYFKKEKE